MHFSGCEEARGYSSPEHLQPFERLSPSAAPLPLLESSAESRANMAASPGYFTSFFACLFASSPRQPAWGDAIFVCVHGALVDVESVLAIFMGSIRRSRKPEVTRCGGSAVEALASGFPQPISGLL